MLEESKKGFKLFIILLLAYMPVHVLYTKILLRFIDMPMQLSVMIQMISYIVLGSVGVVLFCQCAPSIKKSPLSIHSKTKPLLHFPIQYRILYKNRTHALLSNNYS